MKSYPNLSKPITIGKVTIKNRMMMAPMDTGFGNTPNNNFTPEGVEYFVRRAQGGFGLLFSGGTNVDAFEYYGTRVMAATSLKAVTDEGAVVAHKDGSEETIEADTVFMSIGYRPLPSMAAELAGCGAAVYEIGDGAHVGNVLTCIQDAYEVASRL